MVKNICHSTLKKFSWNLIHTVTTYSTHLFNKYLLREIKYEYTTHFSLGPQDLALRRHPFGGWGNTTEQDHIGPHEIYVQGREERKMKSTQK